MSDCNNNCEAVAGLHEAAANLIQYRNLINSWLNGGQNQTVNIGGQNIPTLLGLAMSIKQLVGVWPDDITVKIDPVTKKIYVPLKTNGGLRSSSSGLYVDSSDFLQLGGGLAKDAQGNIYVDFDQMPTAKFDTILETFRKGLRLQKWLTGNKIFYVNIATGSDTLDEGRGESESKPFKSIQACINYVCNNYNIGNYQAAIIVANGIYNGNITLPDFTRNSGSIIIKSASGNRAGVVVTGTVLSGAAARVYGGNWTLQDMTIEHKPDISDFGGAYRPYAQIVNVTTGQLNISGLRLRFLPTGAPPSDGVYTNYGLMCQSGAHLFVLPGINKTSVENNVQVIGNLRTMAIASSGGDITFSGTDDNSLEMNLEISGSFTRCCEINGGLLTFSSPRKYKAGVTCQGSQSGQRYLANNGGRINTEGGGPDFFPGVTDGTVEASTYSWYK